MNEKINFTEEELAIMDEVKKESESVKTHYENPKLQKLRKVLDEINKHYKEDLYEPLEIAIKFFEENFKDTPKEELFEHALYHILLGSSVVEGEKCWADFENAEIENDPKIKKFVEDDLKIKNFVESWYKDLQKENK